MSELVLLQAARLKGRLSVETAAACDGTSMEAVAHALATLARAGVLQPVGGPYGLTAEGSRRLAELLAQEGAPADQGALADIYEQFLGVNGDLKALVTRWQMKDPETLNDHRDPVYDRGVIEELEELDGRCRPVLDTTVALVPRLAPYRQRFDHALVRIREGDVSFVASPMADSYHTVWFELHEELLGLLGRTRAQEAEAGLAD